MFDHLRGWTRVSCNVWSLAEARWLTADEITVRNERLANFVSQRLRDRYGCGCTIFICPKFFVYFACVYILNRYVMTLRLVPKHEPLVPAPTIVMACFARPS